MKERPVSQAFLVGWETASLLKEHQSSATMKWKEYLGDPVSGVPWVFGVKMAFLSRKVDYALLIMAVLHRRDAGASAREIADAYGLGRPFVANILKRLCSKGLVQSHRGVRGGYVLGRAASQITMTQLLEALEDPFHLTECTPNLEHSCNLAGICPVKGAIGKVHKRIGDILGQTTLDTLFEECTTDESAQKSCIQLGWNANLGALHRMGSSHPHEDAAEPQEATLVAAANNE